MTAAQTSGPAPQRPARDGHNQRSKGVTVSYRHVIAILAAAAALLTAGACSGATESPLPPEVTTTDAGPTDSSESPLPLPTTAPGPGPAMGDFAERTYLDALAQGGIDLPRDTALAAAETVCAAAGVLDAIPDVQEQTGLSSGQAGRLVGAALFTCGGGAGE